MIASAIAAGIVALLLIAVWGIGMDLRTWNRGFHRGCGGYWRRLDIDFEGCRHIRCSHCHRSAWIASFIPGFSTWLRGF